MPHQKGWIGGFPFLEKIIKDREEKRKRDEALKEALKVPLKAESPEYDYERIYLEMMSGA